MTVPVGEIVADFNCAINLYCFRVTTSIVPVHFQSLHVSCSASAVKWRTSSQTTEIDMKSDLQLAQHESRRRGGCGP